MDHDGDLDLVTTNAGVVPARITIMTNDGKGAFGIGPTYPLPVGDPVALTLGEWNGDGWLDLGVIIASGIYAFLNARDGTLEYHGMYAVGAHAASGIVSGDLNGDGHPELAVVSLGPNIPASSFGWAPRLTILLNNNNCPPPPAADLSGDGDVDGVDLAMLLAAWGACRAKSACPADLNHDGLVNGLDLAMLLAAWTG